MFIDCFVILFLTLRIEDTWLPPICYHIFLLYFIFGLFLIVWIPNHLKSYAKKIGEPAFHFYHEDPLFAVKYHSVLVYCFRELISTIRQEDSITLTKEQEEEIETWFKERSDLLDQEEASFCGIAQGKNVILIQVESLETQLIYKTIAGREVTPVLNRIAQQSLYFPNIYEQVREGNSSDAELMVNTSLYPVEKGVTFYRFSECSYTTSLAEILKKRGYYCVVAHGDRKTFWNRNQVYPRMGYDEFWGLADFNRADMVQTSAVIGLGLADRSFFHQTVKKIQGIKQPFLLSLITLTTHSPFRLPDELKVETFPSIKDKAIRRYAECFSYLDSSLGDFWRMAHEAGIMENSVIVIFGDHQGINKYYNVPDSEWENDRRIPLIIYCDGMCSHQFDKTGGQIDIMSTLLNLLRIDSRSYRLMGRNLLTKDNIINDLNNHPAAIELKDRAHK
ncbi:MAG: LTA synthase family protein, partial [bacterium]